MSNRDLGVYAAFAMIGILAHVPDPDAYKKDIARRAFDMAEAMKDEEEKREAARRDETTRQRKG